MKQIDEKKKIKGGAEKAGLIVDTVLSRQIRVFRVIFGTITSGIATDMALKIRDLEPVDISKMIGTGIVWLILCGWFIMTYKIEHWDEEAKAKTDDRIKVTSNKLDMIGEIRKFTFENWLPNAQTDDDKIKVLTAFGKMMSFAHVDELKEDFALVHTSIAELMSIFTADFRKMKTRLFTEMTHIMKREKQEVTDDDLFPPEMDKFSVEAIDKALKPPSMK